MQDITTVGGASIWAGDGIHLTSNATRVAALKMMAYIINGSETGEPAYKRARLESVMPVQSTPQQAAKTAPPAPAAAAAQARAAPVMVVRPAAGKQTRQFTTARPAARRTGRLNNEG